MSSYIDVSSSTDDYYSAKGYLSENDSDSDNEYETKEFWKKEFDKEYEKEYGKKHLPFVLPQHILDEIGDVTNRPIVYKYTITADEEECIRRDKLEALSKRSRYQKF